MNSNCRCDRSPSSRSIRILRAAFLTLLGASLLAVSAPAQTAPAPTQSFPLNFTEKDSSLALGLTVGKEEVRFRKEPDFGTHKVLRRALAADYGGRGVLGFAVDFTDGILYLDLNQNLDLTDDPQGVFKKVSGTSPSFALFRKLRIALGAEGSARTYFVDQFFMTGSQEGYVNLTSAYEGKVRLYGREWWLSVQDNLDGVIDERDRLTLDPLPDDGGKPAARFPSMPAPRQLFLDGRRYGLEFEFRQQPGGSQVSADFTETGATLGEIALEGQSVARLVLSGNGLAVLDAPVKPVLVPEGDYKVTAVYLRSPGSAILLESKDESLLPEVCVRGGAASSLKAGAPLESSVGAATEGNWLRLNYILRGIGGETYLPVNPDDKNRPKVAIYQGERLRGTGSFSFG